MSGARGLRARMLGAFMQAPAQGRLTLTWPDGLVTETGAGERPHAQIGLKNWRAVRRAVMGGPLGLAESYLDGDWDTPDLAAVIEFGAYLRQQDVLSRPNLVRRAIERLRHARRENTREGSRRNIAAHYDLGNAFYREWLDPTLTYSSAVFGPGAERLDEAQTNKCRRLIGLLRPAPGQSLLEIGCGWGHFASVAAKEAGLKVTGITLSREQFEFSRRRVFEEGLAERVTIELRDYRDVTERYDHVASVEMFEAVGESYWPAYFAKLRDSLRAGGRAALQVITIDDKLFSGYRRAPDFIQKYVFPGGALPSPAALMDRAKAAGLAWIGAEGFGQHYARTLAEWRRRFVEAWPRIAPLGFDERFKRLWTYYLAYCEGGFRAGNIDVQQIALARN